jgi:DNA polymerase
MSNHLHLDFETFSETDLKKVGAYRYAFDPSTEILCAAMALGDEEPVVWLHGQKGDDISRHWQALENPEVLIYAHNAMFEMAICQALFQSTYGLACPALSRFRCTMSFARRASLPAKLEKLAEVLDLPAKKDNRGKALIKKFSCLPTRATKANPTMKRIRPEDDPAAFAEFCAYCAQDVRVEQQVAKRLAYFDSSPNNENYTLDAIINARGVPVNLEALRHAQKLIGEETEIVSKKFRELVGFEHTQGAVLLHWANSKGYSFPNLKAGTIDEFLDENTIEGEDIVSQALRLKQSIAYASIKKVKSMIACCGPHDNRLRGMMEYHVATTGRWGGRLCQLQNLKRSTIKDSDGAYQMICEGCSREELEICYGPVLEVISSSIRHFVHCQEGEV